MITRNKTTRRNFDEEFSRLMVPLAAKDPELVDFYRTKMLGIGSGDTSPEQEALIRGMIRFQYELTPQDYPRAVGQCVAQLAGIQLGSEMLHD